MSDEVGVQLNEEPVASAVIESATLTPKDEWDRTCQDLNSREIVWISLPQRYSDSLSSRLA